MHRLGAGGKKAWIVRTRAGGKPINKTLGAYPALSLADARDAARDLLRDIANNGGARPARTFGELAEHWIEVVAKPKNRPWQMQKRLLEIHVLPHWKDRRLNSISRADVLDLIDGIHGAVAPNRALTLVRTLFRHAMSRDWIKASPAEAIAKTKAETPRNRVPDMDEVTWVHATSELLGYKRQRSPGWFPATRRRLIAKRMIALLSSLSARSTWFSPTLTWKRPGQKTAFSDALFEIEGPDDDGCVWICSAKGRGDWCRNLGPADKVAEVLSQWAMSLDDGERAGK